MTAILLLISTLMFGYAVKSEPQEIPSQVQQLLNQLPACSKLHEALEQGRHGDEVDQPYMQAMRQQGVERADVKVSSRRQGNEVKDLQVVRTLYYCRYDGPDTQITDPDELRRIRDSGLQTMLGDIAFDRVKKAPFFTGFEGARRSHKYWSSGVEFFSNPWLPEQMTIVSPKGDSRLLLLGPGVSGDVIEIRDLLNNSHFQQKELNRALFDAVLSDYDNAAVIRLLLNAGADVNARGEEGNTPLMNAVSRPCNLQVLLENGARIDARDKWGNTVLKLAKDRKRAESLRILEQAGAK
jgi:Ankyrin repeats (many copies)